MLDQFFFFERNTRMTIGKNAAFVQGASRGIGLAILRQLLTDNRFDAVYASARTEHEPALIELTEQYPERLRVLTLDVCNENSITAAAAALDTAKTTLSLLINCSGVLHTDSLQPEKRLDEVSLANLESSFRVNAFGPLLVAKHFSPFFSRSNRCVMANLSARVASVEDNRLGGWYAYRASKAALNMFTKNIAIELARSYRTIICVALHPGTVNTNLSRPFQRNVPPAKLFEPSQAAAQLLDVIDSLEIADNGGFFAWDGQPVPW